MTESKRGPLPGSSEQIHRIIIGGTVVVIALLGFGWVVSAIIRAARALA